MSSRRTRSRRRRMQALDLHQLTLPLLWSREDVRRSLVVITNEGAIGPEPVAAMARRAA